MKETIGQIDGSIKSKVWHEDSDDPGENLAAFGLDFYQVSLVLGQSIHSRYPALVRSTIGPICIIRYITCGAPAGALCASPKHP